MRTTIKNRLSLLLEKEGLSPAKFAEVIGVQRSSISHLLSGRNKPSLDLLQKMLLAFPHLNSDWLLLGEGEMYKKQTQTSLFGTARQEKAEEKIKKDTESNNPKEGVVTGVNSLFSDNTSVTEIVVFYDNKTFRVYRPSE